MTIKELREKLLQFLVDINDYEDDSMDYAVDRLNDIASEATYRKQ